WRDLPVGTSEERAPILLVAAISFQVSHQAVPRGCCLSWVAVDKGDHKESVFGVGVSPVADGGGTVCWKRVDRRKFCLERGDLLAGELLANRGSQRVRGENSLGEILPIEQSRAQQFRVRNTWGHRWTFQTTQ